MQGMGFSLTNVLGKCVIQSGPGAIFASRCEQQMGILEGPARRDPKEETSGMKSVEVSIPSGNLTLEGCLDLPDLSPPFPGVLFCHPHPPQGGNMDNNVVVAVGRALVEKGIAVLRFNFRGVGMSEGSYDQGIGEQDDARAALKLLLEREEIDPLRIGIGGYSFGGMIAFSVGAGEDAVKALAGISPVMREDILKGCQKPKIVVYGTADNVVPAEQINRETNKAAEPMEVRMIEGADHFWWGLEERLAEIIAGFFAGCLNQKKGG